jgi:long-chain acyl-CoA synthetase
MGKFGEEQTAMMLAEALEKSAKEQGERAALIYRDEPISYAALWRAVETAAAEFTHLGIGASDKISILLPNCPSFVIAMYAAAKLGVVSVPVNPLLKPAELEYIWRDSGVKLVVTADALLPSAQAAQAGLPGLAHIVKIAPDGTIEEESREQGTGNRGQINPNDPMPQPPHDRDCAIIIYTSGTTGHPKGAMLSHHNLLSNVKQINQVLEFTPDDVLLTALPMFHAFAGTVCTHLVLATGCTSVLLEGFVPNKVMESLGRHRVTIFPAVPAMLNALLAFPPEATPDLSALRYFVSGGAPLPQATLEAIEAKFGVPVLEGDGPTECSPVTSVNPPNGVRKINSVGPALPGVEVAIWDDNDTPVPTDEIGEIVVRGDNVMMGYFHQPEATAEAMKGGWYHTGDLGKIDSDGYIYIVDRKKDMIITGGLNVYPSEIEAVLRTHPTVQDAAVIGTEDALRGEAVLAVVMKKPDAEITERELIAFCRERMANYKVPRKVVFREQLTRGTKGQVLKRLLKKELDMESVVE